LAEGWISITAAPLLTGGVTENKLALGRPFVGVVLLAGGPFIGLDLDGGAALGGLALGGCFLPGAAFSEALGLALVTKPLLEDRLCERPALAKGAKAEDEAIKKAKRKVRRMFKGCFYSCEQLVKTEIKDCPERIENINFESS
jgi:hypothetical protein